MKKFFAVGLLVVFALGMAATTVLAADPVAPVINQVKSLKQKWVEITLLLGDLNGYLFEIQNELEEASGAEETTKLAAIQHIKRARTIKDLFILQVVIPEIEAWVKDLEDEKLELEKALDDLEDRFCPGGCLPKFPGFSRVFVRIRLKLDTINTIFDDFKDEIEDLEGSLGEVDEADTTGNSAETCLDPGDSSTPLDQDAATDPETLNECMDMAELYMTGADPNYGPDDFPNADLALERAGTQLIPDMIEPQKQLLLRKLRQVQIELTSIERELKRLQRVKLKRRPAEEITQVQSASLAGGFVALQLPTLKDVLDEIKGLRILTKDAEFFLHEIDDELDFILDLLAQAKAEIKTGATASEIKTLIDLAIEKKELTLLVDLFSLKNTIDEMIDQKEELEEKIVALCDAKKIKNPKSCFRILDELKQINAKLDYVKHVIAFIKAKLEDEDQGEDHPPCETADPCDDVDDWLADAMDELETAGDDYDAERIIIDIIKAIELIQEAMAKKDCILLGISCPVEDELRGFKGLVKWILAELRFVEKLVRKEIRPVIQPRPRSGELEPLAVEAIEATTRELRVLGTGIAGFTVRVYGLNGQLVVTREVEGSGALRLDELRAANGAPLANGVYLYVVQVQGYDGQVIQSQINKLVILR